jgi:hypothetical protein
MFRFHSLHLQMSAEVGDTIVRPSKRARVSSHVVNVPSLQCQVCHRTYDRIDHLNRHLDSRKQQIPAYGIIFDGPQIEMKDPSVAANVLQHSIGG